MVQEVWENYLKYRPPYPDTQWEMWLDYHEGPLGVVHEIGTGCGIGMAKFLKVARARGQPIGRAVLSDPSESNIVTTKAMLTNDRFPGVEFDLHQQPAEACFLESNSIDMVFACECLHFTEINECLSRMHESLRPGGTMAATFYDTSGAEIIGNPRAERAYQAVFSDFVIGAKEGRYKSKIKEKKMLKGLKGRLNIGLNWVPLYQDKWTDISRVFINVPDGQEEWPLLPAFEGVLQNVSNINKDTDKLEWVQDIESWGIKTATIDWIRGLLGTMEIQLDETFWEGPLWKELVEAVDDQGGAVHLVIRANYIMARKK